MPNTDAPFTTLVVDGDSYLNNGLGKFLEAEGHQVITATDPKDVIEKVRQHLPDMILVNIESKGIVGLDLLAEMLLVNPHASVILMAGRSRISEAVEAIKAGAVDYLEWPLDLDKLKQAIEAQKQLSKKKP
jgi:DNA-binding NtrC family response regulator